MNRFLITTAASALFAAASAIPASAQTTQTETGADVEEQLPQTGAQGEGGATVQGQQDQSGGQGTVTTEGNAEAGTDAEAQSSGQAETGDQQDGGATEEQQQTGEGQSGEQEGDDAQSAETGGEAEVTEEQQAQVRQSFSNEDVERVEVDFDINIGIGVPQTVTLHPVPTYFVEYYPRYEGYLFFITADGTVVIVAPDTREIVYIVA